MNIAIDSLSLSVEKSRKENLLHAFEEAVPICPSPEFVANNPGLGSHEHSSSIHRTNDTHSLAINLSNECLYSFFLKNLSEI